MGGGNIDSLLSNKYSYAQQCPIRNKPLLILNPFRVQLLQVGFCGGIPIIYPMVSKWTKAAPVYLLRIMLMTMTSVQWQCDGKSMFVFDTSTRKKKFAYDKDQVPPVRALTRIVYILSLVRKQAGRSYLRWGDFNRRERFPDSGKWWIGRWGRGCKGMMLKGTEVMLTMGRGKV